MLYRVDRVLQSSSSWDRLLDLCNCDSHGICAFNKNSEKGKFVNERYGFSCELFEINPYCWEDCTCGVTDLYSEVEEHSGDCPFVHHNFIYHPTGFYIDWYKYSFRSSDMNQNLTIREIEDIFDKCSDYLESIGFTTNRKSIEYEINHDPVSQQLSQKQFDCKMRMNATYGCDNIPYCTNADQFKQLGIERSNHSKELSKRIVELRKEKGL